MKIVYYVIVYYIKFESGGMVSRKVDYHKFRYQFYTQIKDYLD